MSWARISKIESAAEIFEMRMEPGWDVASTFLLRIGQVYLKTNHMPVRFLIYVAITALTRLLISNVSHHNPPDLGIIYLCGGILLLAFSILVVRYASSQFPSVKIEHPKRKTGVGSGEHPEVEKGEL